MYATRVLWCVTQENIYNYIDSTPWKAIIGMPLWAIKIFAACFTGTILSVSFRMFCWKEETIDHMQSTLFLLGVCNMLPQEFVFNLDLLRLFTENQPMMLLLLTKEMSPCYYYSHDSLVLLNLGSSEGRGGEGTFWREGRRREFWREGRRRDKVPPLHETLIMISHFAW